MSVAFTHRNVRAPMRPAGFACLAGTSLLVTLLVNQAASQDVPPPERFVVASVKPAAERVAGLRAGPDHYYRVTTLASFVEYAFDLPSFLIVGMPDWASNERFEISAKSERSQPNNRLRLTEMQPLMRALLEERFALRVHRETRDLPIYELVSARDDGQRAPGLTPATGECKPFVNRGPRPFSESPVDRFGLSRCLEGVLTMEKRVAVQLHNFRMDQFASALRSIAGRPVVDKTGFSGLFDFVFDFRSTLDQDANVPLLETALRESFGLRLQSSRGMVEVLAIESVDRPTPN